MSIKTLTNEQIDQLTNTTHPGGIEYPANGLQPYYHWLVRSLHRLAELSVFQFKVDQDANTALSIYVAPGRATVDGATLNYAGGQIDLSAYNNQTALVYVAATADIVSITNTAWPTASHLKIAEVTVEAGAITAILDRRLDTLFTA